MSYALTDIPFCIDQLDLRRNYFQLDQREPPHNIVSWAGTDPQPTNAQLAAVWDSYQALSTERAWAAVEGEVALRLYDTDWTQIADAGISTEQVVGFQSYRSAVIGVRTQTDPENITWPVRPSNPWFRGTGIGSTSGDY